MAGTTRGSCSSKVVGSQAGYPKASRQMNPTTSFGQHFKVRLFYLEIMGLNFSTLLENVLKNNLSMGLPIFQHRPPSLHIWFNLFILSLVFRRKCFYQLQEVWFGLLLSSKTTAKLESILEEGIAKEEIIYSCIFFLPPSSLINYWTSGFLKKSTHFLCYKNNSPRTGVLPLSELQFP